MARLTALGLAFAGAGLFAVAKPALEAPRQEAPTIAVAPTIEIQLESAHAVNTDAPPIARQSSRSVSMVATIQGASYMKLEDLDRERTFPEHGKLRTSRSYGAYDAVGDMALEDVPAIHRARLGTVVITPNGCSATIVGFAVVGRLTGSPGYAGDDTLQEWTPKSVLAWGAPMIAAKLGTVCEGAYIRDASLPAPIVATPTKVTDRDLVARAKRMTIASKAGRATAKDWASNYDNAGTWSSAQGTQWTANEFTHPTTGVKYISVHAYQNEGCGSPYVNVFGLYRVEADGTLVAQPMTLGDIERDIQLVDLDNDGTYEVSGRGWLGTQFVNDANGVSLEMLDEPFYGCPC